MADGLARPAARTEVPLVAAAGRAREFVAKTDKGRHEFHELTRIKFSTASEEFTAA